MATIDEHGVLLLRPETETVPEDSVHEELVDQLVAGFKARAARVGDVVVFGRLAWFPDAENTMIRLDPDVMVVRGRPPGHRRSFKAWAEEGAVPSLLVEVVSPEDTDADYTRRLARARRYGVADVIMVYPFAPGGVRVEHLHGDPHDPTRFRTVAVSSSPQDRIRVPVMEVEMAGGPALTVIDEDGPWPDPIEAMGQVRQLAARAEQEAARAEQEAARAEQEAAEVRRLHALLRDAGIDPTGR